MARSLRVKTESGYRIIPPGERGAVGAGDAVDATDSAQALAGEHGIDLSEIEGTGSGDRITKADVQKHVQ